MSDITIRYLRSDAMRRQTFLDNGTLLAKEAIYVTNAATISLEQRNKIAEMWGIEGDYWLEDFRREGHPRIELDADVSNPANFGAIINGVYDAYKFPKGKP